MRTGLYLGAHAPRPYELASLGADALYVPEDMVPPSSARELGCEINAYIWTFKAKPQWGVVGPDSRPTLGAGCPNNPELRRNSLRRIRKVASRGHDGVVLDGIRFPGPSSGLRSLGTCLCSHCQAFCKAHRYSFRDIREVATMLTYRPRALKSGANLHKLIHGLGEFREWTEYRQHSITDFVEECGDLASRIGITLKAAVFPPTLAPLVGQSYPELTRLIDALQPMLYHAGQGPACINFELSELFRATGTADWANQLKKMFSPRVRVKSLRALSLSGLPPEVIRVEARRARKMTSRRCQLAPILYVMGSNAKDILRLVEFAKAGRPDEISYFMYSRG